MPPELYRNKPSKWAGRYRIKSARLQGYDYSGDGLYFVTICTDNRELFFGDVKNNKMILNDVGQIVANEWRKTEIIRPDVFLDEWVIMPNHLHGILIIDNGGITTDVGNTPSAGNGTDVTNETFVGNTPDVGNAPSVETPWQGVSTPNLESTPERVKV